MAKNYPFIEGLRFSAGKFRTPGLLYWSAWLTAANIGFSIVEKLSGHSFFSYLSALLGGEGEKFGFRYLFVSYSILLCAILVSMYISARAMIAAMETAKLKTARPPDFLKWLWLQFYKLGINFSCYYEKKLLIPAASLAAFAALVRIFSPMLFGGRAAAFCMQEGVCFRFDLGGMMFAFAIFFAVLAYDAAVIIHATRTSFSVYMFLEGKRDTKKVVRQSDSLVRGQTEEVFAAQLLAMLALLGPLLAINYITGRGIDAVAGGDFALSFAVLAFAFAISIATLAVQQALSAHIWAFFRKKGKSRMRGLISF